MCGVVGIYDAGGASYPLYYALYALQHRGQESAGITTYNGSVVFKHKGEGLISEVFNESILDDLKGCTGIGHVRYPTTGSSIVENIQPFNFMFKGLHLSICHNGNLVNNQSLRDEYEGRGQIFCTTADTEVIANIIADELRLNSLEDAILHCMRRLRGSYSVILMLDESLYAFRDPLGIRPLCLGKTDKGYIVASESVAVDALNGTFLRDVKPGEMVLINENGISSTQIAKATHPAHCIFEYVYFARADSVIDGRLVYDVRREVGKKLYEEDPIEAHLVSAVPDSGIAHAIGYSHRSQIPYLEALIKNRYMGRTFIMPTQEVREHAVRIKLNPVKQHVRDKSVVLVDDSIVRGTTSRRIIDLVKDAGAAAVHMRVGSPPIRAPCYLGVDMPTREELIASDKETEAVKESIGAESLHHISLERLIEAVGIDRRDLCTGCITGKYPLSVNEIEKCEPRHIDYRAGTYQSELDIFEFE